MDKVLSLLRQGEINLLLKYAFWKALEKCTPEDFTRVTWRAITIKGRHYCCTRPREYFWGEGYSLCWRVARLGYYTPIRRAFYEAIPNEEEELELQAQRVTFPALRYRFNKWIGRHVDHAGDKLQIELLNGRRA